MTLVAESNHDERDVRFLIPVERKWKLWIPPVLAVLYFAFVLTVLIGQWDLRIANQEEVLVIGGLAVFGVLAVWELLLLPGRRAKKSKARRGRSPPPRAREPVESEPDDEDAINAYAPPPAAERPAAAPSRAQGLDAELVDTGESRNGLAVLEVSVPPKSRHRGAIYSKAFIVVDDRFVLRVEDLVADREELQAVA